MGVLLMQDTSVSREWSLALEGWRREPMKERREGRGHRMTAFRVLVVQGLQSVKHLPHPQIPTKHPALSLLSGSYRNPHSMDGKTDSGKLHKLVE